MRALTIASAVLLLAFSACAQNPRPSPKATAEGKNVSIAYGQPSKRDRVIFGGLVPYGQVWRTGANEATEITFAKDGKFGGKPVKAGTYTLWTIPGEKEWSVVLNSDTKFWGTQHEQHKDKDFLTVVVPSQSMTDMLEKLNIRFTDKDMIIEWDKTRVAVPVDFK
jgi:hypothetical protein